MSKKSGKAVIFFLVGLGVIFAFSGLAWFSLSNKSVLDKKVYLKSVQAKVFERESVSVKVKYPGVTEAWKESVVSSRLNQPVKNILFREGHSVSEGDVVIELQGEAVQLGVDNFKARLEMTKHSLNKVQSPFRKGEMDSMKYEKNKIESIFSNHQKESKRAIELFEKGNISESEKDKILLAEKISELDLERIKLQLGLMNEGSHPEDVLSAKSRLDELESAFKQAVQKLSWTQVKAPFAGVISRVFVEKGEGTHIGTPLFEIIQLDRVNVLVRMSESDLLELNRETPCRVKVGSGGQDFRPAKIEQIGQRAYLGTHQFAVKVSVGNANEKIKSGMSAEVTFEMSVLKDVFSLPVHVVVRRGGVPGVFVVRDEKVFFNPIEVLKRIDGNVIVKSGLEEGLHIVVEGAGGLKEEDIVKVTNL